MAISGSQYWLFLSGFIVEKSQVAVWHFFELFFMFDLRMESKDPSEIKTSVFLVLSIRIVCTGVLTIISYHISVYR